MEDRLESFLWAAAWNKYDETSLRDKYFYGGWGEGGERTQNAWTWLWLVIWPASNTQNDEYTESEDKQIHQFISWGEGVLALAAHILTLERYRD